MRRRVGMIFPNPNPLPMSIFDNVAYGPRLHGIKERAKLAQIVEESLTEVGLWHELNRNLDSSALKLPKGQQQRLCIARTLAVDSEVLLMDEPCLNLDPISTTRINNLIHQLKQERTIIIATHDLQQAARIADRTAFFWKERVEEAPTDEFFPKAFVIPGQKHTSQDGFKENSKMRIAFQKQLEGWRDLLRMRAAWLKKLLSTVRSLAQQDLPWPKR